MAKDRITAFGRRFSPKDILQFAGASLIALAMTAIVFVAICSRLGKDTGFGTLLILASFNVIIGAALLLSSRSPVGSVRRPQASNSRRNHSPRPTGAGFVAEIHDHTTLSNKPPKDRPDYGNQKSTVA